MLEHLFVNGCSFNTPNDKGRIATFTGKMVANYFKFKLKNFARGGRGNHRINTTTKLFFETYPQRKKDTVALIEWTQAGRVDYVTNDGFKKIKEFSSTWRTYHTRNILDVLPGFDDVEHESVTVLNHIIDLQNYFKINDIKYLMYFGLPNKITDSSDCNLLRSLVDEEYFFKMDYSHFEYCPDNKTYVSRNDYHPSVAGHRRWANYLIKYMEQHDLRRT